MTPIKAKLKDVQDWATLEDVKGVSSFLGFTNYYRQFVQNFVEIVDPLILQMRTNVKLQWRPYQRSGFQQLKEALCDVPILLFLDPKLPYTVVTDTSSIVVGGVLMQDQGDWLQPLAFPSKRLKPTEQRYSVYEQELAIVAYCLQS